MGKILLVYEDYAELMSAEYTLKKIGFDVIGLGSEFGLKDQMISFNPDIVIANGKSAKVSTVGVGKKLKEISRWQGKSVLIFPMGVRPTAEELLKVRMDAALEAPIEMTRLIQLVAKFTGQDDQVLIEKMIKATSQEQIKQQEANYLRGDNPQSADEKIHVSGGQEESADFLVGRNGKTFEELNSAVFGPDSGGEAVENPFAKSEPLDWNDLRRELLGPNLAEGELPSDSKVTLDKRSQQQGGETSDSGKNEANEELRQAESGLPDKIKKYGQITKSLKIDTKTSTLTKKATKAVQKDLMKSWSQSELDKQDELRRQFTRSMFKKGKSKRNKS